MSKLRYEETPQFHTNLRRAITYHPATGEFTTVEPTTRKSKGERIGTLREDGSYIVSYESKLYTAARLAYFWMTGHWPQGPVKLKTKKRTIGDYRWANLHYEVPSRARHAAQG